MINTAEARSTICEALAAAGLTEIDRNPDADIWPATFSGTTTCKRRRTVFVTWSPGGIRIGLDLRAGEDTIHLRGAAMAPEVLAAALDALANMVTR